MNERKILVGGDVITPYRIIHAGNVVIDGEHIADVSAGQLSSIEDGEVIDVTGLYIAPGFIDMHVHGGGGADVMDGTAEAILAMARRHNSHGTTAIMPTTVVAAWDDTIKAIDAVEEAINVSDTATILGIHLEGPYISPGQKGALDERYVKMPDAADYMPLLERYNIIKRMTAAPEINGALVLGRELYKRGILASIGHSDATYDEISTAVENGYRHITHLYSGMPQGIRRKNAYRVAGIIEAAFLHDDLTVELIADGCHLPAVLLKLVYKIKGSDNIALVTDAMRAAGMPEGQYILGSLKDGQRVVVEDGVAKLMDRSAFAGSVATMDRLVRTMISLADVPVIDAVRMATLTPARILGIDGQKGSITPGHDADLVIFDQDIDVKMVMVGGDVTYEK